MRTPSPQAMLQCQPDIPYRVAKSDINELTRFCSLLIPEPQKSFQTSLNKSDDSFVQWFFIFFGMTRENQTGLSLVSLHFNSRDL